MEDSKGNTFEILLESAQDYIKTSITLYKLNTVNKVLSAVSALISKSVVILFLSLFILIASIGAALLLGEKLGQIWYGFMIVAGFYGIVAIIISIFLNNWFNRIISNFLLKQIVKNSPDEKI